MPCPLGGFPVRIVACAVEVTAGVTSLRGRIQPFSASFERRGANGSKRGVNPTALIRMSGSADIVRFIPYTATIGNSVPRSHPLNDSAPATPPAGRSYKYYDFIMVGFAAVML